MIMSIAGPNLFMNTTTFSASVTPTLPITPSPSIAPRNLRPVAVWLLICCLLVFTIVVVGGITRLTRSGLSIVEWQPIAGVVPPLNATDWQEAFSKYQQTPEFAQVNHAMTLDEFRRIFWWEYVHRLLGRLIGAAFLLPFVWFSIRRKISGRLGWKLAGIFVLGGLQGAMGWYMVKSGLVDDPRVSQYRLTAHLGIAFLIFAAMFWIALDVLFARGAETSAPRELRSTRGLRRAGTALVALVFLMVLSGGLVAGIHAGLAYNTFPLMNGSVVPPELFMLTPWYANFFANMATVQFDHRLIAWTLAIAVPLFWMRARRADLSPRAKTATNLLLAMFIVQITLGISTLLLVVPIPLAAAHQAGAMLLFAAAIYARHALGARDDAITSSSSPVPFPSPS